MDPEGGSSLESFINTCSRAIPALLSNCPGLLYKKEILCFSNLSIFKKISESFCYYSLVYTNEETDFLPGIRDLVSGRVYILKNPS